MARYVIGESSARKLRAILGGHMVAGRLGGEAPGTVDEAEYQSPFSVKWAASVNGGSGAWIIWLPNSTIVQIGSANADPSADLTAAGSPYPSGWFVVPSLSATANGTVYLVINPNASPATATIAASPSSTAGCINVTVAKTFASSADEKKSVKQLVTSSVTLSTGGGEVSFVGTESTTAYSGNAVRFQSASDSNVKVTASRDAQTGEVVLTIGVYYV